MCYGMNCGWESYPNGPNEGCHCRLPWYSTCPMDREDDDENAEADEDDGEDEYAPPRKLDGEEKYWPEWAFRRV